MKSYKFRKPSELKKKTVKKTVSLRIDKEIKVRLEKEAEKNSLSVSHIINEVLKDYFQWLDK